ncbi:transposase IS3/IS911 family protein [Herbaspirillum rubrisubalbicans M1]|nr:transposase IS3/IS911 family protein [Herbaspirillum rubrisubalbicans M1]
MKKRFTEEQIIGVLKEAEAGMKVAEVCRKHGISDATYYNWTSKFGWMKVSEDRCPKDRFAQRTYPGGDLMMA